MSIYQDDSVKNLKFMNGTTDITDYVESGSFSCENILCDDQLSFGNCNSARAQFVTITDLELTGKTITVSYGYGSEWANIGVFKVTQQTSKENSDEKTITMYDVMKNFDVDVADWYIGLSFPMTLLAFRNALCSHIGITQESVSLINDDMTVYETIAPSKLNAMDLMKYIGEINGVWPHASLTGTVEWLSLSTSVTTVPASVIQGADGVVQKDYVTSPISKLCIRSEDGDVGVTVGTGANTYYVTGNVLCYGLTTEQLTPIATNLFNKIDGISYTPTEIVMKADPTIKMGSLLIYNTKKFYVLSRKTSGLLFDDIVSDGNQYLEEDSSIETSVEQLRGKSNVLTRTIEGVSDKVETIEDDYTTYTEFSQTTDEIKLTISEMEKELDGSTEIYNLDYQPTLTNYPYWDWTGLYPAEDLYPSDDLYFPYPATELQKHIRTMVFDTTTTVTYRFLKVDGQFLWKELEDTETSIILSRLTTVEATVDGLSTNVQSVQYDLENNYWGKTETQSAIDQKADSITTSVASTYTTKSTTETLDGKVDSVANNLSTNYYTSAQVDSAISQSASEITSTVSGTYATQTDLNSLSNNLSNNYLTSSQVESKISQSATSIKSEVAETYATGEELTSLSNNLSSNYYTSKQTTSAISQSASEITSTVAGTYATKSKVSDVEASVSLKLDATADAVVSKFEAYADEITLNANASLALNGGQVTISSGDFTLDENGGVTAKNITIEGGTIDIDTESKDTDKIALNYGSYQTTMRPAGVHSTFGNTSTTYGAVMTSTNTSTGKYTEVNGDTIMASNSAMSQYVAIDSTGIIAANGAGLTVNGSATFHNTPKVGSKAVALDEDVTLGMKSIIIEADKSATIAFTKNAPYTMILNGGAAGRKGMYICYITNEGTSTITPLLSASECVIASNPSNNSVTVKNNSSGQVFLQVMTSRTYIDRISIS